MQLQKNRVFFFQDSKPSLFLILNSNLFHSRGGGHTIAKRAFTKVFAFYQGYNQIHFVINSQLSLVFTTCNMVTNILWCNGMVCFIGYNQIIRTLNKYYLYIYIYILYTIVLSPVICKMLNFKDIPLIIG